MSYAQRTRDWDEFPNGRWGDSRSPAYGELNDYHLTSMHRQLRQLEKCGGGSVAAALRTEADVWELFCKHVRGELPRLPWSDDSLSPETLPMRATLLQLNAAGYLTINSQPRVNAAPSDDRVHGWGGAGGRVYQKAYLEFFTSPALLQSLLENVEGSQRPISTMASNRLGEWYGNFEGTNAVTWGVFPGREILQPTVVESVSFKAWRDEAFSLWYSLWIQPLPEDSPARARLQQMYDSYFLVSVVDNDYLSGDIFSLFAPTAKPHEPATATSTSGAPA
jgi:methylenetetrahydrofolate reductase (NADPH)